MVTGERERENEINMCVENSLEISLPENSKLDESSINQNSIICNIDVANTDLKSVTKNNDDLQEPGKGKKIIIQCYKSGKRCINLVDTGSSTSLVTRKFVVESKIATFKSRIPISFWGLLASSTEMRDIAILEYHINSEKITVPAYVIDDLPNNIDVLLGTDQIGKQFGITIPIGATPSVSIRCGDKTKTFKLADTGDGNLYADRFVYQ